MPRGWGIWTKPGWGETFKLKVSSLSGLIQEEELKGKENTFMSKWLRKTISPQETDTHNKKKPSSSPPNYNVTLLKFYQKRIGQSIWMQLWLQGGGRGRRERNMICMSHSSKVQMHGGLQGGGGRERIYKLWIWHIIVCCLLQNVSSRLIFIKISFVFSFTLPLSTSKIPASSPFVFCCNQDDVIHCWVLVFHYCLHKFFLNPSRDQGLIVSRANKALLGVDKSPSSG